MSRSAGDIPELMKKAKEMKVVILYSGGLDSFIMKKYADSKGYDVTLVHYDIGQPYSKKEDEAIKNSGYSVDVRKIDWLRSESEIKSKTGTVGNIMIPGRNLVLATLAASTYLPDQIWMGGLKGEDHVRATDKNKKFITETNKLWSYVYSPYNTIPKLVFPLVENNWGKFEAVKWAYDSHNATQEEILKTSSCLNNSDTKNCGSCVVCCRRKYIFMQLGFSEPMEVDPLSNKENRDMIIDMLRDTGRYDSFRKQEILPGLYIEFGTANHDELLQKIINYKEIL